MQKQFITELNIIEFKSEETTQRSANVSKIFANSCFDNTWGIAISSRSQRRQESELANQKKGNNLINRSKKVKKKLSWVYLLDLFFISLIIY